MTNFIFCSPIYERLTLRVVFSMVNNAGVSFEGSDPQPIWTAKDRCWDRTLAVNATGCFYGCRAAAKQMITQEPHPNGDRGWIINVSSVLGMTGKSGSGKCLMIILTKSEYIRTKLWVDALVVLCALSIHTTVARSLLHSCTLEQD